MALTSLDIQNKTFPKRKLGGYDLDEVDDFLDHVQRDYEMLASKNRELEKDLKHAKEKLSYFDELKDSLNESIIVAQDTASKVKSNAANEADVIVKTANQHAEETVLIAQAKADQILSDAKTKAQEILVKAIEDAKQLAAETDDLKKKSRVFHQRLTLMLESQLQTVKSLEWEEMLKPFSTYIEDHHAVFKEIVEKSEEIGLETEKEDFTEVVFPGELAETPEISEEEKEETSTKEETASPSEVQGEEA